MELHGTEGKSSFIYYNVKQPHNDFPMTRITIFAIGKTLNNMKERKPWHGREGTGHHIDFKVFRSMPVFGTWLLLFGVEYLGNIKDCGATCGNWFGDLVELLWLEEKVIWK